MVSNITNEWCETDFMYKCLSWAFSYQVKQTQRESGTLIYCAVLL